MKVLLHSCCGPCTIYPYESLKEEHDISVYFFNPNIHPYKEFQRRKTTLLEFCRLNRIEVVGEQQYGLREYLRKVVGNELQKCQICYSWRMEASALFAKENGFDAFTTTLLYSKYQNHDQLKLFGHHLSSRYDIDFIYKDFRDGWQYGIDESIRMEMYRQPYCGCIYSEQERYDKRLRKKKRVT